MKAHDQILSARLLLHNTYTYNITNLARFFIPPVDCVPNVANTFKLLANYKKGNGVPILNYLKAYGG
jgi:hypothetical protein